MRYQDVHVMPDHATTSGTSEVACFDHRRGHDHTGHPGSSGMPPRCTTCAAAGITSCRTRLRCRLDRRCVESCRRNRPRCRVIRSGGLSCGDQSRSDRRVRSSLALRARQEQTLPLWPRRLLQMIASSGFTPIRLHGRDGLFLAVCRHSVRSFGSFHRVQSQV